MSIELMCRKIGMSQVFTDAGDAVPVTVLEVGPNTVVQLKSEDGPDGYIAAQLGFGEIRDKLLTKAQKGHFEKAGVASQRHLVESRLTAEEAEGLEVGQEIKADIFEAGQKIDAIGTSKGRGFAGVVKRHGFAIKKMTHGTHEYFRHPGSIGAGAYPGRVFKGMKLPGHMGAERVTVQNLEVMRVDGERNLLFIKGAVPGHNNGIVRVRKAIKS